MSVSVKKSPTRVAICCRKADPFQGPKLGSCLTLGSELSKETHVLTKQEILLGKSTLVESSRVRKSILKSRDITLPTMVHLVKAMVFPVIMYRCESWTVKKAER